MRNLKKVLSLVLALAMVLSICVVGAGAVNYDDFTDEGEITKKQAVETLVSLDVIKGYNDGATFNPTGNVTRAEMATMICRVLAGGDKMIPDATKPVPTYNDVRNNPSAAWAETYIEYCTSLGIVSGKGNGIFDPMADVTAAEAAKMVMTALGYNADIEGFKGIGWDINTMAKASTLKLTDNLVGEISANAPMTRQQVAQLLFNALDDPMVQYYEGNNANVWIGAGNVNDKYYETLLETKFNAEKVVGVVVANEYADLADTEPLAAGRTRVIVLGTDNEPVSPRRELTVNLSTNLDKIGESIIVYRDKASNRIIFGDYQDTGLNQISEITWKTSDITKGDNAVDKSAKDAEQYVNFSDSISTIYTARRSFTYSYEVKQADGTIKTIKENVPKGTELGSLVDTKKEDRYISYADLEWVYDAVNTERENDVVTGDAKNTKLTNAENENYANFEEWAETYLTVKDQKADLNATSNENGNYIKVVDYNSDGEIDYVLKTVYTASTVQRVSKDGEVTLSNYETLGNINYIERDEKNAAKRPVTEVVVEGDEVASGDVVLYAVIDGTAYISLAEMTTAKIDKVHRNTVTVDTVDGDTYGQSGVNMIFKKDAVDDLAGTAEYSTTDKEDGERKSITEMKGDTTYEIFFDHYGYVVAYRMAASTAQYVLLTDGWYAQWKDGKEYAVKAVVDGKIETFDLADNKAGFIEDDQNDSVNNAWNRLKKFCGIEATDTNRNITSIASYTENAEGQWTLTPVDEVTSRREIRVVDLVNVCEGMEIKDAKGEVIKNGVDGNKYMEGYAYTSRGTDSNDGHRVYDHKVSNELITVRPRTDTVYYYVYDNKTVDTYVGYKAAPKVELKDIKHMYAVSTKYNDEYDIANVIVVELDSLYTKGEPIFLIDGPDKISTVKDNVYTVIRKDGTVEDMTLENGKVEDGAKVVDFLNKWDGDVGWTPGLYMMYETRKEGVFHVAPMTTKDFKDSGFTVGIVTAVGGIRDADYIVVGVADIDEVSGFEVTMDKAHKDAEETAKTNLTQAQKDVNDTLSNIRGSFNKADEVRSNGADNGLYYLLSYGEDIKNKNPNGTYHWVEELRSERDYEEVMADAFELDSKFNDYNMVLVMRDKSGDILYGVSFEHDAYYKDRNVREENYAAVLWEYLVATYVTEDAGATTAAPTAVLNIYDEAGKNVVWHKDLTANAETSITKGTWGQYTGSDIKAEIVITAAADNELTANDMNKGKTVTVPVVIGTDKTATVMSTGTGKDAVSKEYSFTVRFVGGGNVSLANSTTGITVTAAGGGEITVANTVKLSIQRFVDSFNWTEKDGNATWTFKDSTGKLIDESLWDRYEINSVEGFTVTAIGTNGVPARWWGGNVSAEDSKYVFIGYDSETERLYDAGTIYKAKGLPDSCVYTITDNYGNYYGRNGQVATVEYDGANGNSKYIPKLITASGNSDTIGRGDNFVMPAADVKITVYFSASIGIDGGAIVEFHQVGDSVTTYNRAVNNQTGPFRGTHVAMREATGSPGDGDILGYAPIVNGSATFKMPATNVWFEDNYVKVDAGDGKNYYVEVGTTLDKATLNAAGISLKGQYYTVNDGDTYYNSEVTGEAYKLTGESVTLNLNWHKTEIDAPAGVDFTVTGAKEVDGAYFNKNGTSMTIAGLEDNASLNRGEKNADGTWTYTPATSLTLKVAVTPKIEQVENDALVEDTKSGVFDGIENFVSFSLIPTQVGDTITVTGKPSMVIESGDSTTTVPGFGIGFSAIQTACGVSNAKFGNNNTKIAFWVVEVDDDTAANRIHVIAVGDKTPSTTITATVGGDTVTYKVVYDLNW